MRQLIILRKKRSLTVEEGLIEKILIRISDIISVESIFAIYNNCYFLLKKKKEKRSRAKFM
jgi:hypothetical protein